MALAFGPKGFEVDAIAIFFALFGLHHNWARNTPADHRLVRLSNATVRLKYGKGGATPNSNEVGASFAASAARAGLKTIMFVNQANHAASTARDIRAGLPAVGMLTALENDLWQDIIAELGGAQHSFIDPTASALPHNGDMIAIERRLAESLFRRRDGASVIVATPDARERHEPSGRGGYLRRDHAP